MCLHLPFTNLVIERAKKVSQRNYPQFAVANVSPLAVALRIRLAAHCSDAADQVESHLLTRRYVRGSRYSRTEKESVNSFSVMYSKCG
jgi:hypothetical protein